MTDAVTLLVGTRKGAFIYRGDQARKSWQLEGPYYLGNIVNHMVADPRDGRTILMAAKTGHLGPTVFRSNDGGKHWTEAQQPPVFRKVAQGEEARAVESVFWL
ncbi:MAG: sialidase family protein, partial [Burkholderiales bacterium]